MIKKLLLPLILFSFNHAFSQQDFEFDFDYARFKYDSVDSYIEFYYLLGQKSLSIQQDENGFYTEGLLKIILVDAETNETAIDKEYRMRSDLQDTNIILRNRSLIGVVGFILAPGRYKVYIEGSDLNNPELKKGINEIIIIDSVNENRPYLSDAQLASSIKKEGADPNSIFFKNTLEITPHPNVVFGSNYPVLYYYSEIYNLSMLENGDKLFLEIGLINSRGKQVYGKSKFVYKTLNNIVEVGAINISQTPTDSYSFVIVLRDSLNAYQTSTMKKLFIYNPHVEQEIIALEDINLLSSEYAVLSEEECDEMFSQIKYIATQSEIKKYSNIDSIVGKRNFLLDFWKQRDPDPTTPYNEYKGEYLERVRLSNDKYGSANRPGFKTDRGRVYIVFGEPDQIDRYPSEMSLKPYEIWSYNSIEGGVVFIFGDLTGFGNYELLSSTKRGEIRDDNWQRRITIADF